MPVMASMTAGFLSVVRFVLEDWREQTQSRVYFPRSRLVLGRREAEQVTKFRKIVVMLGERPCTTTTLTTYIHSVQYRSHKKHTTIKLVNSMPA